MTVRLAHYVKLQQPIYTYLYLLFLSKYFSVKKTSTDTPFGCCSIFSTKCYRRTWKRWWKLSNLQNRLARDTTNWVVVFGKIRKMPLQSALNLSQHIPNPHVRHTAKRKSWNVSIDVVNGLWSVPWIHYTIVLAVYFSFRVPILKGQHLTILP